MNIGTNILHKVFKIPFLLALYPIKQMNYFHQVSHFHPLEINSLPYETLRCFPQLQQYGQLMPLFLNSLVAMGIAAAHILNRDHKSFRELSLYTIKRYLNVEQRRSPLTSIEAKLGLVGCKGMKERWILLLSRRQTHIKGRKQHQ